MIVGERRLLPLLGMLVAMVAACDGPTNGVLEQSVEFDLTRPTGVEGWSAGFADYPVDGEEGMELVSGHEVLPPGLSVEGRGLYSAGTNGSDDLFMFWKRRIEGLRPMTRYRIETMVEFVTRAPVGCVGTGGAPGESVYLKAGAAGIEPEAEVKQEGGVAMRRMNIQKGAQSEGGANASVLGHIGTDAGECDAPAWGVRRLESQQPLEVATGPEGVLWLLIGTDSGFEGRSEIYFTRMRARFRPM